jgi:hypothetical protein
VQTDLTKPNSFSYRATYTVLGDIYYYNQAEEITAVDIELLRNKEHTLFAGLIQRDKHFLIGRLTLEVIKKDILNNSEINTQEISVEANILLNQYFNIIKFVSGAYSAKISELEYLKYNGIGQAFGYYNFGSESIVITSITKKQLDKVKKTENKNLNEYIKRYNYICQIEDKPFQLLGLYSLLEFIKHREAQSLETLFAGNLAPKELELANSSRNLVAHGVNNQNKQVSTLNTALGVVKEFHEFDREDDKQMTLVIASANKLLQAINKYINKRLSET